MQYQSVRARFVRVFFVLMFAFCLAKVPTLIVSAVYALEITITARTDAKAPLERNALTGRVSSTEGKSLTNATIEWHSTLSKNRPFVQRTSAMTDLKGNYSLPPYPDYKSPLIGLHEPFLVVTAPGFLPQYRGYEPDEAGSEIDFVLTRTPKSGHTIAGVVVDEQGSPIEGVEVKATTILVGMNSRFSNVTGNDYLPGPGGETQTDAQGRFQIRDLATHNLNEKKIHLSFQSKYRSWHTANYPIREGLRIKMRGSGKPGVLQARLIDAETGLPPKNLDEIRIIHGSSSKNHPCNQEDGHFRLPMQVRLAANHTVSIYTKEYEVAKVELTAVPAKSNQFEDIYLKKKNTSFGRLLDADTGFPISGASIMFGAVDPARYFEWREYDFEHDIYSSKKSIQRDTTNRSGSFWYAEQNDVQNQKIILHTSGYQRVILTPDDHRIDTQSGEIEIRLKRESTFSGIASVNNIPIPNVKVTIWSTSSDPMIQKHEFETTRTDKDGRYHFNRLFPSTYCLRAGPYVRVATIGEGEEAILNLGEELGKLKIFGKAPADCIIGFDPKFEWEYTLLETISTTDGLYEIPGLRPGIYRVRWRSKIGAVVRKEGRYEIKVEHDGQQIDILTRQQIEKQKVDVIEISL